MSSQRPPSSRRWGVVRVVRRWRQVAIAGLAGFVLGPAARADGGPEPLPFRDARLSVEVRVTDLLGRLTLDEKLGLLSGVDGFFVPGVERLGVPRLKMGDGPVGVRNWGESTLYPATVLLAATWSEALATRFGTALGRDSRARGMHISLAPGANIHRAPLGGRNYEYLGEDPFLASRLAVASIRAVQAQGVAATIKHFAANNSETRRSAISNEVDERTLREIYLPVFRAAVEEAGVGCVMNAYNLLNGDYCTAHSWLNHEILKGEWGFTGVLMSDWHATHDTEAAVRGGLDLEMPGPVYFAPEKLRPLLTRGAITEAQLDDKVRRILRLIFVYGWLDREQQDRSIPLDDPASAAAALAIAREGITLLKNERAVLPLAVADGRRVAVLGPNAAKIVTGLGSGRVRPFRALSISAGLRARLGPERVVEVPWPAVSAVSLGGRFTRPVRYEVFTSRRQSQPLVAGEVAEIALAWDKKAPAHGLTARDLAFARWTTELTVAESGDYEVAVEAKDAGVRLWLDDTLHWDSLREARGSVVLRLTAGQPYRLRVEAEQRKKDFSFAVRVGWGPAAPLLSHEACEAVRTADAAVVVVGFNVVSGEGEGNDRPYVLPGRQEELIREVARLNPRTIVVLNSGSSVATASWLAEVPALLHAFYPGQEGGRALAEIVCGDVNPSGHLPFTYERRWEDCAAYGNYAVDHADESVRQIAYREGILVGYRWFDRREVEPLYPFGHGLSYTTFAAANLRAERVGEQVQVTMDVTNTGARFGATAVQLYIGQPSCAVPRPVRELKQFSKVTLAPGECRALTFTLPRAAFAFFHPEQRRWVVEPGEFILEAGFSARDLPQRTTIHYEP